MQAILFHDFDKVTSYYGPIPQADYGPNSHSEVYEMRAEDRDPLDEDFTDAVNAACGTVLGYGDVDFLIPRQCQLLTEWIADRLQKPITPRLAEIYHHFDDYARRAVEYNTGMIIEL